MSAPLVQTPIQLATYNRPRAAAQLSTNAYQDIHGAHVAVGDVVRAPGVRDRQDLIVTVEQGAAVVLVDLQSQSPLQTHTLAPSDRVTAPPLVVERRTPVGFERVTFIAMASGSGSSPTLDVHVSRLDSRGRHVDEDKSTVVLPAEAIALFAGPGTEIIALTREEALVVDSGIAHRVPLAHRTRLDTCVLDAAGARALLAKADGARLPDIAAAICIISQDDALHAHVIALYERGERAAVFGGVIDGLPRPSACSVHGTHICVLDESDLVSASLAVHATSARALDVRRAHLGAQYRPSGMLLVTGSHLLLVAFLGESHGKERVAALVWDVDYDTVLAQVEWTLSMGHGTPQVSVARAGAEQVALQIDTLGDKGRSSVLVLPLSVPTTGLLRHALGTAAQTNAWFDTKLPTDFLSPPEQQLLDTLTDAPDGAAVDERFSAWVSQETERIRALVGGRKARPELGPAFVAQVLDLALPSTNSSRYARETVRYLVERGAVSASMRSPTGETLVRRIIDTRDWTALLLVLRHVPDIAEAHAIAILRDAFVDEAAPPLARVLTHVLAPPTFSKPQMRLALRQNISSETQVLVLLDILRSWLDTLLAEPLQGERTKGGAEEETVEVGSMGITYTAAQVTPPPLNAVISFAEDLLDTYFPQLLAMPSCHAYIEDTLRMISQHVSALQTLARLQGPLDAFAHHAEASKHDRRDSRSRRLALYEASLVVPPYSVDQLEV